VGPETDKYRLSVSGFAGDAGDALAAHPNPRRVCNGMQFTAMDQDNDLSNTHCGHGGKGWWFNACSRSLLNHNDHDAVWQPVADQAIRDVRYSRMLVKLG